MIKGVIVALVFVVGGMMAGSLGWSESTASFIRVGPCDCAASSEDIDCAGSSIVFANGPNFNSIAGQCNTQQSPNCFGLGFCEFEVSASFTATDLDCGETGCDNWRSIINGNAAGASNPCETPGGESSASFVLACGSNGDIPFEVQKHCAGNWTQVAMCKYRAKCAPCAWQVH